jgi:RNA polymerase sigma-70 factor (ECF subfamily)
MTLTEECGLAVPEIELERVDPADLVSAYAGVLYRVAYSVLRNEVEAEDVVQDCFVRVLEHRAKLAEVRDMRVWLVRIAWNLALDRRRRVRPTQMDEHFAAGLMAASVPQDQAVGELRELTRVLAQIDRLPRKEREALLLSAVEEVSTAEIAVVLGRSESAIRALLFRARARLREQLGKEQRR